MQHIELLHGDCLEVLKQGPDNSVDAIVTDPPAGISFMGKAWDSDKGGSKEWIAWLTEVSKEMLRVLKPGGHGLVWAIPRTSHWTATALENAGFEIRDVVTHLFGTGFPKSLDISKAIDKAAGAVREKGPVDPSRAGRLVNQGGDYQTEAGWSAGNRTVTIDPPATPEAQQWSGWGTALKPASEHWILVRKPISEKTVAANVLKWGTGGINIDASRIAGTIPQCKNTNFKASRKDTKGFGYVGESLIKEETLTRSEGRFPANLVLDETAAAMLDSSAVASQGAESGPSRFFYVAKASTAEKSIGLAEAKNTHPTVKSLKLMEYLIKLVTPPRRHCAGPVHGQRLHGCSS